MALAVHHTAGTSAIHLHIHYLSQSVSAVLTVVIYNIFCVIIIRVQGVPLSWKHIEFSKTIFQTWKVIENNLGRG